MKMKWVKRLVACTLSVALLGAMAGCGNNAETKTSEVKGNEETQVVSSEVETGAANTEETTATPQTLKVIWWGSQGRADSTQAMIDLFEEKHPGVTVEIEFTDYASYTTKISTYAVSGNVPDVMQMDTNFFAQYANNNIIADLTPYIESGALDLSSASASLMESGQIDGAQYAVPTGANAPVFVYRQDVLDECGLTMPEKLTWETYMNMSKTIYEKTGRQEHLAATAGKDQLVYLLAGDGLTLYNEAGDGLGFDDPSYLVDMWKWSLKAIEEGYGPGVGESTAGSEMFASEVWAAIAWSNGLADFETLGNCELTIRELPWVDENALPSGYLKPAMHWSVAESSEVKDLAVEFINFFINDIEVYDIVGIDRGIPIAAEAQEYMASKVDGIDKKVFEAINYLSQDGMVGPFTPEIAAGAAEVADSLVKMSERVNYGAEPDLEKAAKEWMETANKILKDAAAKK